VRLPESVDLSRKASFDWNRRANRLTFSTCPGSYPSPNHVFGSPSTKHYFFDDRRVATRKEDVLYCLAGNHLGTTSLVLAVGGNKAAELRYRPYGETRYHGPPSGTPTDYRFTSQCRGQNRLSEGEVNDERRNTLARDCR
jgi:hypothetical protein